MLQTDLLHVGIWGGGSAGEADRDLPLGQEVRLVDHLQRVRVLQPQEQVFPILVPIALQTLAIHYQTTLTYLTRITQL